jgi:HlyD family secretion protein
MGKTTIIVVVVIAALAGGGIYWALREEPKPPERVTTARVHRSSVTKTVRGVGHIEPVTQVKVSANISGDLLKLNVTDGARVTRGELLAEIDREQWMAVVRQGEARSRAMHAAVSVEQAQLEQAQSEEKRTLALKAQNLAPDSEVDKARSSVAVIVAKLESAKQGVAQAEAELDEAKAKLAETRVIAPIDGTVISLLKKQGEKIRGSDLSEDILLVLAPLHAMQVEVEVTEQDVVGLLPGQLTEIVIDALGETKQKGKVVEIANSAIIRNRGLETETTSFAVKVALDEIPPRLRSGMSAQVAIATETKDNVIAVPIESVTARLPSQLEPKKEGEKEPTPEEKNEKLLRVGEKKEKAVEVVFVLEGGNKAMPIRVKTGIYSENEIEIVEGLNENQEIIVGPYKALSRTLQAGMAVEVANDPGKTPEAVASER